ncbi:RxLR effector protein [Phytophthora megakarya]|uniref:RxLR effector protein n=1 Tax=Phytophthora megakarya TaxID=4795 RepID=A0A225VBI0_9STRA|nr:RxLR effector protein [Phytophthora megakarya]
MRRTHFGNMRSSFILLLVVVTLVLWCSDFSTAEVVRTSTKNTRSLDTIRYLRAMKTTTPNDEALITALREERFSFPVLGRIKAAFQKNPSFAKSLENFRQKRTTVSEFLAENKIIKKDIIIVSVLLSLLVTVPILVKSFYPA